MKAIATRLSGFYSLLLVSLLGLPLVMPLLNLTAGPCTHDGHLHYHRLAALRGAWANGLHFSRWLPDLAFGYGYPFFIYREAAPLYLSLAPHLLGLPLPGAINLFYALCILAAGWFMFLWVRDLFGPLAGIVSAVAYMAAPYQLIDALIRGNQPESLALALFPLLCWSGRRFVVRGTAGAFLLATLALALLALSHNISLLLFTPFLGLYLLLAGWLARLNLSTLAGRLALVFGLGLGLSAFYVGPALLELDEITISQSVTARDNDFHFNFAALDEIFSPVPPADPDLLNPPLPIRLGWLPFGLALLGLVTSLRERSHERRGHALFMAAAAVALLLMALPLSRSLWEALPLIEFVQFPWRFIGRAALPVAFLAGMPFARPLASSPAVPQDASPRPLLLAAAAAVAIALLSLEALPYLYPRMCPEESNPTLTTVHTYEHQTGLVGVDPLGSYFPKTVQSRPKDSPLEADYLAGRPPQRFDLQALPPGATTSDVVYHPTSVRLQVDSPTAFEARYLSFAFPGWRAQIDGQDVPITPGDPDGLITFPVPAGRHEILVAWGLTRLRTLMAGISALSLVGVVAAALVLSRRAARLGPKRPTAAHGPLAQPARLALLLVALGLLGFKALVVDRVDTPFRRSADLAVTHPADLSAAGLHLTGYNLSGETVAGGGSLTVDLAWEVIAPPAANLQSNLWLVGPAGLTWSDKETARPRLYEDVPSSRAWLPGQRVWDSREIELFSGTPPGRYDLVLTLFDRADLQPLTLLGPGGAVLGPTAVLGQVEVTRPASAPTFQPRFPLTESFPGLSLLGFNQDRAEAAPGDLVLLTLFWEQRSGEAADSFELLLLDDRGRTAQSWTLPPVRSDYPPADWRDGERLRGQHALRLAAALETGRYRFTLNGIPLGDLAVQAPDRLFEPPAVDHSLNAGFFSPDSVGPDGGLQARLVGYSLALEADGQLRLDLLWKGVGEMTVSYRVFVHLVDESGTILAQSDAEPAAWTRPTTGWAPGEYILDSHRLALAAAGDETDLAVRVGLYDPDSGLRLRTAGTDFLQLPLP